MDNFFDALATGQVKSSGVMNYLQHLLIAQRCRPGARVLDVCCGRALSVPILKQAAPSIRMYVGVDISPENLREASLMLLRGDGLAPSFECRLIEGDVRGLADLVGTERFDVIAYTSSIEHMDRESGAASLCEVAGVLAPQGRLYLSTPITPSVDPPRLQYRVHVYEWDRPELEVAIEAAGLMIEDRVGLLPSSDQALAAALVDRFGESGRKWLESLRRSVPAQFLDVILAAAFPDAAKEILFVCAARGEQ